MIETYKGNPPKIEFIKKLCIYSYMFKLHSSSKYSSFGAIMTIQMFFSTAQNSFWTHQFWCFLMLLLFFVSPLPKLQNISFWGLFHLGKQKKVAGGEIWWIGKVGHGVMLFYFIKNCWTLIAWCGHVCW